MISAFGLNYLRKCCSRWRTTVWDGYTFKELSDLDNSFKYYRGKQLHLGEVRHIFEYIRTCGDDAQRQLMRKKYKTVQHGNL